MLVHLSVRYITDNVDSRRCKIRHKQSVPSKMSACMFGCTRTSVGVPVLGDRQSQTSHMNDVIKRVTVISEKVASAG